MKATITFDLNDELDTLKYKLLNNIENIMADFDDYWMQLSMLTGEYDGDEFVHKDTMKTDPLIELLNDAFMPEGVRDLFYGYEALKNMRKNKIKEGEK